MEDEIFTRECLEVQNVNLVYLLQALIGPTLYTCIEHAEVEVLSHSSCKRFNILLQTPSMHSSRTNSSTTVTKECENRLFSM